MATLGTGEVINQFNQLGLTIDDNIGAVSGNGGVYFFLSSDHSQIYTFDRERYSTQDIIAVTRNQNFLSIAFIIKGETVVHGFIPKSTANKSVSELVALLPVFIKDVDYGLYYDIMYQREMVDDHIWGNSKEKNVRPCVDADFAFFTMKIENGLNSLGWNGRYSRETREMAWNVHCNDHQVNTWLLWLKDLKWDGKPRVDTWFKDCLGATAPALKDPEAEFKYISSVTRALLVGAISRAFKETVVEVTPVLVGRQGDGKSSLVRFMAGPQQTWYRETNSDVSDAKTFCENVAGAKVVELAESKQLRTVNVEDLKMFISKSSDQFREAYGRKSKTFIRQWVMIATSNDIKIFVDKTGNRRFYPIICDRSRATYSFYDDMMKGDYSEVEQLWAEAYQMYLNGELCVIDVNSQVAKYAEVMQKAATFDDERWTAIEEYLDDPANNLTDVGARISRADIMTEVFGVDARNPPKEVSYSVTRWMEHNKDWRSLDMASYKGKTTRNVMQRMMSVEDAHMLSEGADPAQLVKLYDRFAHENNIAPNGDARIDEFITSIRMAYSYRADILQRLLDNDAIFLSKGRYYRL